RAAPDNILASRFLGECLEGLGDLGAALNQFRTTLRLAPGDRQVEAQIRALEQRLTAGAAPRPMAAPAPPRRPVAPSASAGPGSNVMPAPRPAAAPGGPGEPSRPAAATGPRRPPAPR